MKSLADADSERKVLKRAGTWGNSFKVFAVPFLFPAAAAAGLYAYAFPETLSPEWCSGLIWLGPALYHMVVPVVDAALHQAKAVKALQAENPQDASPSSFSARAVPFLAIVLHLALTLLFYHVACVAPLRPGVLAALTYSMCLSANVALAASHELVHSRLLAHQLAAEAFLCSSLLHPYYRAHHHHHKDVATPTDYTCASRGQAFLPFFVRYLISSYRGSWALDAHECARVGAPLWSARNRTLVGWVAQVAILCGVGAVFGSRGLLLHTAMALLTAVFLVVVDYVLHYGLARPPLAAAGANSKVLGTADTTQRGTAGPDWGASNGNGVAPRYSPITVFSSWNSPYELENALTFNVLRHSDHHLASSRGYKGLATRETYPLFPAPVAVLALAALITPLWRAVMDPRADAVNRANEAYLVDVLHLPLATQQ